MKKWNVITVFGPDKLYERLERLERDGYEVFTITEGRIENRTLGRVRYTIVAFLRLLI
jgi:hypothetical protein